FAPGVSPCRMPPRDSQIESSTKPPPAVTTHAISAAHLILHPPFRIAGSEYCLPAPAVCYRGAPIAAERLRSQSNSGRGLAALVLGAVDQLEGALDDLGVEAVRRQLLTRAVLLDIGLEDAVELGVGRQRVLVELVLAQLGGRCAVDDRLRDQLGPG